MPNVAPKKTFMAECWDLNTAQVWLVIVVVGRLEPFSSSLANPNQQSDLGVLGMPFGHYRKCSPGIEVDRWTMYVQVKYEFMWAIVAAFRQRGKASVSLAERRRRGLN